MKLLLTLVMTSALAVSACGGDDSDNPTAPTPAPTINVPFSATDLRVGTGATATNGRSATVRYVLWAYSTTAPDNKGTHVESNSSYNFVVGGNVIQGFSMGVNGMQVGGLRRVVIPPNLAYGNNSPSASIRPNETLLFEVELLAVQ